MPLFSLPSYRRLPSPLQCIFILTIGIICIGMLYLQNYVDYPIHKESEMHVRNLKTIQDSNSELEKKVMDKLHQEIAELNSKLERKEKQLKALSHLTKEEKMNLLYPLNGESEDTIEQIKGAYILQPHQFRNEYEIPSFVTFTKKSVLNTQVRLIKQPEIQLSYYTDLHNDLTEVIETATALVNDDKMEFVEGIYRLQHNAGTQYELSFKSTVNTSAPLLLVTLFRPFTNLVPMAPKERHSTETVYIIVPLQGRGEALRKFVNTFKNEGIIGDGSVHLTIVCFGPEALEDAEKELKQIEKQMKFKAYKIVEAKTGEFSRGRALQLGSENLPVKNPLMFFCDVDMFFSMRFLQQCRVHTLPGKKVFYPVVFSLYNPEVVYKEKTIPPLEEQRIVKRDNGFWRDFGFGMTCQYKKDFDDIGGFDLTIKGWGSEDVLLYRKYARSSKYQVVRTPVNTIFHHWHPKHCDKSLSLDQYNACLRTRSITEGSQVQLGMLYLKSKDTED